VLALGPIHGDWQADPGRRSHGGAVTGVGARVATEMDDFHNSRRRAAPTVRRLSQIVLCTSELAFRHSLVCIGKCRGRRLVGQ
jgi:hypothetical protein